MSRILLVAVDLLREAFARKWILAIAIGITLILGCIASALRLEVVDGALAATKLFGSSLDTDVQAVDVALKPVFAAASYIVFYGGLLFGLVATADFAPALLSPGRIELMLAQPLRRSELLVGTYLGVTLLAALGALYGAGGFALILGLKTGVWSAAPILAGLLASIAFAAIYGVMLAAATFVRSAALAGFVGAVLFVLGVIAGYRDTTAQGFESGWGRATYEGLTLFLPRISALADVAGGVTAQPSPLVVVRLAAGVLAFGLAALCVGIWQLNRKDF